MTEEDRTIFLHLQSALASEVLYAQMFGATVSSRHREILENLDRTPTSPRRQRREAWNRNWSKQWRDTEQAWNKAVKFQEVLEQTGRCHALYTAEAKRVAEMWSGCEEARRNLDDAVTDWEETKTK